MYPDQRGYYPENVDEAPYADGVYGIFTQGGRCIYVGMSDAPTTSIRGRLQRHVSGSSNTRCINSESPWYYTYELKSQISGTVAARERALIREYKALGQAPCNDIVV